MILKFELCTTYGRQDMSVVNIYSKFILGKRFPCKKASIAL